MMQSEIVNLVKQYENPGDFTYATISDSQICEAERRLSVQLPAEYIDFLRMYGHGGIGGIEVIGVGKNGKLLFVEQTEKYRGYGLPNNLVLIENCDEWVYCIDCNSGKIITWSNTEIATAYFSFSEYLLDRFNDAVENM